MTRESRSKHSPRSRPLYSAAPQIIFRDMLPDEDVVRTVNEWYTSSGACPAAVASVTIAPGDERHQHRARVIVADCANPIEATGQSPSMAVERALDRLRARTVISCLPGARGAGLTLVA